MMTLMRRLRRRLWSAGGWLLAGGCFWAVAGAEPASRPGSARPNVLFLISDDLTATALGAYGNPLVHTPNLDRLATRSVRFTRAYCQFPVCGPARAALMSGLYTQTIGVTSNGRASRLTANLGDRPTLPQWFRQHGWFTARVSKIYHMRAPGDITAGVDGPDHLASWTERYNCRAPEWMTHGQAEQLTNEKLKFDPDRHYNLGFGGAFYVVHAAGKGAEQADFQAADRAVEILRTRARRQEPFFLAVGFVRPHVPLVAPEAFFNLHPADLMKLPPKLANDWEDIPAAGISKNSRGIGLAGHEDRQKRVLSAYYAATAFMDAQAGRVLVELDRLGLRENTIVVFTSDHGYHLGRIFHAPFRSAGFQPAVSRVSNPRASESFERAADWEVGDTAGKKPALQPLAQLARTKCEICGLGEHDFWQKMSLHEESVRVPLLISGPGLKPAVTGALAEAIDLYPTLATLAGLKVPAHCQGRSLEPVLRDPTASVRDSTYTFRGNGHLLRTDRWAYLEYTQGGRELYDMRHDPRQFTNLVDQAAFRATAAQMEQRLHERLAQMTP